MHKQTVKEILLEGLTSAQKEAVCSLDRKLLVIAGAGSGKTEVMARRIAWWVMVESVPKETIIAFTFTEKAAKEIKYRVRKWINNTSVGETYANLGGMYIGTIHGFCIQKIREYWPEEYHNYDILDESARSALINRGFYNILGLSSLRNALGEGTSIIETIERFTMAYDQLHEHNLFKVSLPSSDFPYEVGKEESSWCSQSEVETDVGGDLTSQCFAVSAARYYSYLRCRRFLDFSTSQTEFLNKLLNDSQSLDSLEKQNIHLVVDEMQDTNPVQMELINTLIGDSGSLTIVGDHRQSIYGFRGAKVKLLGELWSKYSNEDESNIKYLEKNFRSTPRIINIANSWADSITPISGLGNIPMYNGNTKRIDQHESHIAMVHFIEREDEANWIAEAIKVLVPDNNKGALHDKKDGTFRGLSFSDIAILVRSTTDVQVYMHALKKSGIPSIVKAGPDLFSQAEVLLIIGALAVSAGIDEFKGSAVNPKSIVRRIELTLECPPFPLSIIRAAGNKLRDGDLNFSKESEDKLIKAANLLRKRIFENKSCSVNEIKEIKNRELGRFLTRKSDLRRIFPQTIFQWLLIEADIDIWDTLDRRGEPYLFHLGTLSNLITGLEIPGWTDIKDYKWQILALIQYGSKEGRDPEQPLIVQPDAVTISTIHGVKGLEFPAVFIADVCARRFPSSFAKRKVKLPLSGKILLALEVESLYDNENNDDERRLMYVALTRAERFLIVSYSGKSKSKFIKELNPIFKKHGAIVTEDSNNLLEQIKHAPVEFVREVKLSTSFSELRYYLACPHDFYFRKVLGFSPTIDQAFGYGRGVHNLLREVHSNPSFWAKISSDEEQLEYELDKLLKKGLFYLRYTTGQPAENMRLYGVKLVKNYIRRYLGELSSVQYEPEKEFETLLELDNGLDGVLVTGAIDVVRKDDPPQVTLIDFKSGNTESDSKLKLDEEEMRLQVGIYAIAAKNELEYIPEEGLVRYLDSNPDNIDSSSELRIPLNNKTIQEAQDVVIQTAINIRNRNFYGKPIKLGSDGNLRCYTCDFVGLCGMENAMHSKQK